MKDLTKKENWTIELIYRLIVGVAFGIIIGFLISKIISYM